MTTDDELDVIAEGVGNHEVHWTLRAGGDDANYATMLRTEDRDGIISNGGMGGPKLWGGDLLNVCTGGNPERGPRRVVVRCHPSVVRLVLVRENEADVDLVLCGDGVIDGLRFAVSLVSPDDRLREIVGLDDAGSVVQRFDLRFHDVSWHRHRRNGTMGPST